ncbi:MAG: hypothetical protein HQ519_08395 [Planctomycetes bacterium]|nr:hypothetical protein [Planctomycetota bacterium]
MLTFIAPLFLCAGFAQEPAAKLSLGEQWQIDAPSQTAAIEQTRRLALVPGQPLVIWLTTSGPICSVTVPGLPTSGAYIEGPTVQVLAFTPTAESTQILLSVEAGQIGAVGLRIAKLESAIQYARQQWPDISHEIPADALRGLLAAADERLHLPTDQSTDPIAAPPWLRGFIQLLQSKQFANDGRTDLRLWWQKLLASPVQLNTTMQGQIQESIGTLYQADGQPMLAMQQFREAAIQAKLNHNAKRVSSALNHLEALVQLLPSAEAIYKTLSELAGQQLTTPTLSYLLAEAQWELGYTEDAQENLWQVQKSLVEYQRLGQHCRVHHLLGKVAMELEQWKNARWHLEQAIEAGQYYLRDTSPSTSSHQEIRVHLAEIFARQAAVMDYVNLSADADKMLAEAMRALPHTGATRARLLTLEISAQLALQRGRISSAKSHLAKAEQVLAYNKLESTEWRGQRSEKLRLRNLAALNADLAWASAPGGRGKSVWYSMAAVDRWKTGNFISDWTPGTLVRNLPKDAAVIEYCRGMQNLYAFRADTSGVMMWNLGKFEPLAQKWSAMSKEAEELDPSSGLKTYLDQSYYLYKKLLAPMLMKSDRQIWLCVPSEMQSVQFHALADRPGQSSRRFQSLAEASIVAKNLALTYVDSGLEADQIWQKLRDRNLQLQNPALELQAAQLRQLMAKPDSADLE